MKFGEKNVQKLGNEVQCAENELIHQHDSMDVDLKDK
jgi:hypothetical protein